MERFTTNRTRKGHGATKLHFLGHIFKNVLSVTFEAWFGHFTFKKAKPSLKKLQEVQTRLEILTMGQTEMGHYY